MAKFKNRIIGSGEEDIESILFNPDNWRIHPKLQQDALQGVLEEVGWVQQVVVNRQTGHLIDGHLRCELAMRRGEKKIPVVYVDLTEEEEQIILSTFDPIGAMAAIDSAKRDQLIEKIKVDNDNVVRMLASLAGDKSWGALIGDEYDDQGKRTNNSMQQAGDSKTYAGLQCREIMVVLPIELYQRWWNLCKRPNWESIKECVMEVLEAGLNEVENRAG